MKRIIALGMLFIFITSSILLPRDRSKNSAIHDVDGEMRPAYENSPGPMWDPVGSDPVGSTRQHNDGGWYQGTYEELLASARSGVSVSGVGAEASVNLSTQNAEGWWEMRPPNAPGGRYAHDMAYDSGNDLAVLFGGITDDGERSAETWLYDPSTNIWTPVFPSPAPAARYYHAMAYDSANDKVVLYGGITGYAETWLYDVEDNEWVQKHPNPHPPMLYGHKMTYDSANKRMVLFGGLYYSGGWRYWNETWVYDVAGNEWTKMTPSVSPSARYGHDLAYDPVHGRIVLFGGYNGVYHNDTWVYDLVKDRWTEVYRESPPPRKAWHSMVYDSEINRVLLHTGYPSTTDVWQYDTGSETWTQQTYNEAPSGRYLSAMVHDSTNRKNVLFGGYYYYKQDTWVHDHTRYSPRGTLTSPVITLPDGYEWDLMSLDKNEMPGTYINVSIINAVSSSVVPGFNGISRYHVDLSSLNDLGVDSIRLEASFKGTMDITPSLSSWGIRWGKGDMWYENFIGDSDIFGSMAADDRTSALWDFDEGSGQNLPDASGNGKNGTLGGGSNVEPSDPAWVNGKYRNALRFDGEDDYIWVEKDASIIPDDTLTVETWFKLDGFSKRTMAVMGTRSNGGLAIQVLNDGTLKGLVSTINLGPDEYNELNSRTLLRPGEWYHVALVFDRPDMVLYLDGREESRLSVDFPVRHSNVPLFLGAEVGSSHFPYDPTNFFYGIIDEIRMSNFSRSPDELRLQSRTGLDLGNGRAGITPNAPTPTADAVLLYGFEEQYGGVIRDSTVNRIPALNRGGIITRSGRFGKAIEFNGTDGHLMVVDSDLLHLSNATYQFWVNCPDATVPRTLFSEEKEDSHHTNEQGTIDATGHVHYVLDNGSYDIRSAVPISLGRWVHLAFVRVDGTAAIYIDGVERARDSFSGFDPSVTKPLLFGGNSTGINGFKGIVDEIMISDETHSPHIISENARRYRTNASFRSRDIELEGWNETAPGKIWHTLRMDCALPANTEINVSIRNSDDRGVILRPPVDGSPVTADMRKINVLDHPRIYIEIHLTSDGTESPSVSSLEVNWSDVEFPVLTGYIFENLLVMEDMPRTGIKNVSEHFYDAYADIRNPTYEIGFVSESENIGLALNVSLLDVTYLGENWTGVVTVGINCTNVYGRSTPSNHFKITVTDVDDRPVWIETPGAIVLDEDENLTFPDYFPDHVFDAESNSLIYGVNCDNENITVEVREPDTLFIQGNPDYWGKGNITAIVSQRSAPALNSSITVPVEIRPVNDPPTVVLRSPERHSIQTSLDIDFSWESLDVDSVSGDITFDFHLSKTYPPLVYLSDIGNNSVHVENLDDGSTYFWKVVPKDGEAVGSCVNGTWSFNINTTVLYPESFLKLPLNGTILNVTEVNLTWIGLNPTNGDIDYSVYLGPSGDNLTEMEVTRDTWFLAGDLEDNATYYWTVIPVAGIIKGPCRDAIWSFRVNTSFVAVYDLKMEIPDPRINITQGENCSFHIYLTNLGNVPIMAKIEMTGVITQYVEMDKEVLLPAATRVEVFATIDHMHTRVLKATSYSITIQVTYQGGMKEDGLTISVYSSSPSGDDDPGGESTDTVFSGPFSDRFWLWVLVGVLVLVVISFMVFVMRKKGEEKERKRREELDVLEADIVQALPPPPGLPPMKDYPALPQYSGGPGYGPGIPVPQLAQQPYAPATGGEAPKQLPPAPVTGASASSPEYIPPPPGEVSSSAPAPSVILPDLKTGETKPVLMKLPPAPDSEIQVPRIHAPMPVTNIPTVSDPPGEPAGEPPGEKPASPQGVPVTPDNKYTFSRTPRTGSQGRNPSPVPAPAPAITPTETGTIPASEPAEGNVLDNLQRLLEEMPGTIAEKEMPVQPPTPPPAL